MDKAIEYLKNRRNRIIYVDEKLNEAIAELQAHKAKLENLKEWCKEHTVNTAATKYDPFWKGYQECSMFILQKLEELDK